MTRAVPTLLLLVVLLVVPPVPTGATPSSATRGGTTRQLDGPPQRIAGGAGDPDPRASASADGQWVAFTSLLEVTKSVSTGAEGEHVFVRDLRDDSHEQIDLTPSGDSSGTATLTSSGTAPRISHDGRYVAFVSPATDLDASVTDVDPGEGAMFLYLRDRQEGTTQMISQTQAGDPFAVGGTSPASIDVSGDGQTVAYEAGGNPFEVCGDPSALAVYLFSLDTGRHTLVSADGDGCVAGGTSQNPRLSHHGDVVAFDSDALNVGGISASGRNVWTADLVERSYANLTADVEPGTDSRAPAVSADGHVVVFQTDSGVFEIADTNEATDVYLHDRRDSSTRLVSVDPGASGAPGPGASTGPQLSDSGRYITFASENELVGPEEPDITGGDGQVGVYQLNGGTGLLTRVDQPPGGQLATQLFAGRGVDVADTGATVFSSEAENLDGDEGGMFLRDGTDEAPAPPPQRRSPDEAILAAIAVSKVRFTELRPAEYGVLATIDTFADALSGAVLSQRGPLLLTGGDALDDRTLAELDRVLGDSGTVYVLGGTEALSEGVETSLSKAGYTVVRLSGASRFETSTAIATRARELFGDTGEVALARAFGPDGNPTAAWADSVTGGGYAANTGTPIILTPSEVVHPAVQEFLDSDAPATVHLLGGSAALEETFEDLPGARRTAGATRADTARQIALDLWAQPEEGSRIYLVLDATIELGWAFGLPAAGLAADADAPILATAAINPPETLEAVVGCDDQVRVLAVSPLFSGLLGELRAQDLAACA